MSLRAGGPKLAYCDFGESPVDCILRSLSCKQLRSQYGQTKSANEYYEIQQKRVCLFTYVQVYQK